MANVDPSLNISQAIAKMEDLIDVYRQGLMNNYFTYEGAQWDSDPQSITNISGAVTIAMLNSGNLPAGFQWRDYNNNMHAVTGLYMYGMAASYATFVTTAYGAAWEHKANIDAFTDPIACQEYDYMSTLWPDPNTQY